MNNQVLHCQGLTKTFEGQNTVPVLNQIDFSMQAGEQVAIVGASGSGKSTLLHLLGGLDAPTQGQVSLMGQPISQLSAVQRSQLRNQHLGFIYQFHHLLAEFTAVENVAMPLMIAKRAPAEAQKLAKAMLERVGLGHRLTHKPSELSGGERQRAAIARALINKPSCVLADEPTGNLDVKTAAGIVELMMELNHQEQVSFLVVTHDLELAARMQTRYQLKLGELSLAA